MQIGIDQIINIGTNIVVDPKKLLCSICCTLNIEARECLNKKCKKLFCLNCINSLKNIKNNESDKTNPKNRKIPCPFCRVEADFYKAEENLTKIISNLKFECLHNSCTGKFTLDELKEHNLTRKNLKFCYKCKDSTFLNYSKCLSCNNVFCNDCDFMKNCLNCQLNVCDNCISTKYKNKENFLCGECEPKCSGCERNTNNDDAKEICSICNKVLCSDCILECNDCGLILCKEKKNCKKICKHIKANSIGDEKCWHKISLECEICFPRCKYKLIENSFNNPNKEKIKSNKSKNKNIKKIT